MELNKSFHVFLFFACIFSFSRTEATFNIAFGPSSSSPTSSPLPINHHQHHPSFHFPCTTLFSPADIPFHLSSYTKNSKLNRICSITENPTKCASLIAPCIVGHINSYSALNAVILSLSGYVESALAAAIKLSKSKSLSSEVHIAINKCIEIYSLVLENLKRASIAFKAHDMATVKTMLTASITNFGYCDEAFHQQGLTKNWPLKRINQRLTQLAGFGVDFYEKLIIKVH